MGGSLERLHVVCFSGGESSALAAVETVRKYGKDNVILLNHDISPEVEHQDIKRFKLEVADYLKIPITYANMPGWETLTPVRVCKAAGAWKVDNSPAICTNRLKTAPFEKWLAANFPSKPFEIRPDLEIIYGFDPNEASRIQRRVGKLAELGYKGAFPLIEKRTLQQIEDIGIRRPATYDIYQHANCIGCLKAGKQQWYITYCLHQDLFEEAKAAEASIGYSLFPHEYLEEIEETFMKMKCKGIIPSEKITPQAFWHSVKRILKEPPGMFTPCDCTT